MANTRLLSLCALLMIAVPCASMESISKNFVPNGEIAFINLAFPLILSHPSGINNFLLHPDWQADAKIQKAILVEQYPVFASLLQELSSTSMTTLVFDNGRVVTEKAAWDAPDTVQFIRLMMALDILNPSAPFKAYTDKRGASGYAFLKFVYTVDSKLVLDAIHSFRENISFDPKTDNFELVARAFMESHDDHLFSTLLAFFPLKFPSAKIGALDDHGDDTINCYVEMREFLKAIMVSNSDDKVIIDCLQEIVGRIAYQLHDAAYWEFLQLSLEPETTSSTNTIVMTSSDAKDGCCSSLCAVQ